MPLKLVKGKDYTTNIDPSVLKFEKRGEISHSFLKQTAEIEFRKAVYFASVASIMLLIVATVLLHPLFMFLIIPAGFFTLKNHHKFLSVWSDKDKWASKSMTRMDQP